ncbi:UNVERIFIED_CONTAM: hypothetical protein K2H54_049608 [Gekko kuhli]
MDHEFFGGPFGLSVWSVGQTCCSPGIPLKLCHHCNAPTLKMEADASRTHFWIALQQWCNTNELRKHLDASWLIGVMLLLWCNACELMRQLNASRAYFQIVLLLCAIFIRV